MTEARYGPVDPAAVDTKLRSLADQLAAAGALRSREWREAILATPRHVFLPRFFKAAPGSGAPTLVTADDPNWLDDVYRDEPLVTQFNATTADSTGVPTSSSTAPDLMIRMLEALDIEAGHRVLEIGTGTGYNAALLCHRVGDTNVTTIDVDEALTGAARTRLARLGLHPTVVTGDGANGHPPGEPYDRIIATCSVRRIPSAWLGQVVPGGTIMATIETSLHGYALAAVAVDDRQDGHGHILAVPASFMPMRSHADPPFAALQRIAAAEVRPPRQSRLTPSEVAAEDAKFVVGLALPDVASFITGPPDRHGLHLAHHTDHTWATVEADGVVTHGGHRDLWSTVETTHRQWTDAGRPSPSEFDVTATTDRQSVRHSGPGVDLILPL